jgi:hypothetical protein
MGGTCRRNGESRHVPILEILDRYWIEANQILDFVDGWENSDSRFRDGPTLRDDARRNNYCDECQEMRRAGSDRNGMP